MVCSAGARRAIAPMNISVRNPAVEPLLKNVEEESDYGNDTP